MFTSTVGLPTSTTAGFTVQVANYDASYNWNGTANFGNLTVIHTGPVSVSGAAASTAYFATTKASESGFTPCTL
jgi:hypothetical protein